MNILAEALGKILGFSYNISFNYPVAIIIFTLITKIILFPINIIVQKNGIKMVKMTPEINRIKHDYYGDKERINEETFALYKREKYSPLIDIIPMIIQLIILMGIVEMMGVPEYSGISFAEMKSMGIDFSLIPFECKGIYFLFPVIAALSAIVMCIAQNKAQVLQAEQGNLNKYGMMIFSALLSLYLGLFVRSGVALYWIFSNVFSTIQIFILNAIINPKKYIDYEALEESKKKLEELKGYESNLSPELKKREKADYKRFFSIDNKHLVFFSEASGFYKYFRGILNYLTSHSSVKIHYVTNDPNDIIFEVAKENKQIIPYYIGKNKSISLFMKMDAKVVVMTTPDLEKYYLKRSYVCKDIEYVYMEHGLSSVNMLLRKGALDHFDTVFCAGDHVIDEIRAMERVYNLPEKNLIKYGYGMLDDITRQYLEYKEKNPDAVEEKYALIAPSYQKDNILDSCLENVVNGISKHIKVVIRPHPQYVIRFPQKWAKICSEYADHPMVTIEEDFSSNETIYKASFVVTDWSNISYEYSFSSLRPSMSVNTPTKVINEDYEELGIEPIDFRIRSMIGYEVSGNDENEISEATKNLLENNNWEETITKARDIVLYNFMKSDEVGGKYILSRLKSKQSKENAK
ncbi:MAG: YidC/Oxa1 family membrane protein insertase [Oscillospiraceae bacterium]|nr:YidC/Oxa1 family membrane protein insertase [Oscillospiraceae bacterium]